MRVPGSGSRVWGPRFLAALCVLCGAVPPQLFAAADEEADTIATALRAEEELTKAIQRVSAAFVFVGGGSGVVVSPDGHILTNHHVAGDRKQWTVRLHGAGLAGSAREGLGGSGSGRLLVCDLAGTDPVGDLALLKAREARDLPYVEFGDIEKVRIGQQVLAVGDPFKLGELDGPPSVSLGTVSALHRFQQNYCDAIQTDAAVNPGNSGGPLLTLDGKLIGITGQIMSRFGAKANTGIGYAIPIDQIARFYPLLKAAGGAVVYHGTLPDGLTVSKRVEEAQEAVVEKAVPGSDAARAGFQAGDRIVSVAGKPVYNGDRLTGIVRSYPENTTLEFLVERAAAGNAQGKQKVSLQVRLPRLQLPPPRAAQKEK